MKLKQIEEIATHKVPLWQPTLLITLLLLGYIITPQILENKKSRPVNTETLGSTLGVNTIKEQLGESMQNVVQPYSARLQLEAGKVLGIAQVAVQQKVQDVASQSAEIAKEFIFDNTIGKAIENYKILPPDQQELIKKAICK